MIAPTDDRVQVGAFTFHYLRWGAVDEPVVILLHGGSAHAHWWDFVAPALADRYRLIAPDLRGHGDSTHAVPPSYRIDDYADDLEGFVHALGIERFAMIGHSLGGVIALRFTDRNPERVWALGMIDSRPVTGSGRSGLVNRLSLLPHPVYADREEAVRRFRLLPRGTSARPEVLRSMALAALKPLDDGRLTLKFDRNAFSRRQFLDLRPALATLRCPTLIIRGTESAFVDAAVTAEMQALCPHAEVIAIAGAHHHVVLDRPEETSTHLRAFLARAREQGGR
jgi:pimeloyl-ACP methyl ester carboxylesterase